MQEANDRTVLGDFNNATFVHYGVETTFFRRDGRHFVRTDGPDGTLAEYEIKYTFGVFPLQQYLVAFPGGRLQALSMAWDSRSKDGGGQRWFHLYPGERIAHDDQLHWTGLYQNWNLQCAECHSTNLRKGYDAAARTYSTTFSEINVACEACHGAGSRHVQWARTRYASSGGAGADKGLVVGLHSGWDTAWQFEAGHPIARREAPADPAMANVCSACHARRATLAEGGRPGEALEQTHRLAVLTPPNYHADGQQEEEVYTWGSFLQSLMFQKGVTCVDCHEPHALKLRAEGNALCSRCHDPAAFDTPKHHFHPAKSKGAACVECHMPAQKYMVIDARRDHSFRVPRPDISASVGAPNACTMCHTDREYAWAAAAMDKWYGPKWRERPQHGLVLHQVLSHDMRALPSLMELARDPSRLAIVRATAATAAQPYMRPAFLPVAQALLKDQDPTVRIAALGMLEPFPPAVRLAATAELLGDRVRGVRLEAARVLADVPDVQFPPAQKAMRDKAIGEYVESLKRDSDWPAANASLGSLYARQARTADAARAYWRALELDPRFVAAYVNLADLYRQEGRDSEGEKVLRQGLALMPRAADLRHALGLLLVRRGDRANALRELGEAASAGLGNVRYAYVYAIALNSAGRRQEALAVLGAAIDRYPYDPEILHALVSMSREHGAKSEALIYARRMLEILPDDPTVTRLVSELERGK